MEGRRNGPGNRPRCEMRAILKAVQVTPKEGTAHIHTDSLGSIQSINNWRWETIGNKERHRTRC